MIVKIQMPLRSNMEKPQALVYNEDRSFLVDIQPDANLIRLMKGNPKVFFHIDLHDGPQSFEILEEAPWQDW